jgi:hypothetical protein
MQICELLCAPETLELIMPAHKKAVAEATAAAAAGDRFSAPQGRERAFSNLTQPSRGG